MFTAIFLAIAALYVLSNAYIASSLWKWSGIVGAAGKRLFYIVYFVLASAFIVSQLAYFLPDAVSLPLNLVGGWFMQSYILLLILVPICRLALRGKGGPMTAAVLLLIVIALTAYGAYSASDIKTKSYTVETQKGGDLTIALISDIHLGEIIGAKQFAKMVDRINAIEPDIVMIAGDIFDSGPAVVRDREEIGRLFGQIKSPMGIYACLGNHDGGFRGQEGVGAALLESWGVRVLQDESVSLEGLNIIGRKDRINSRMTAGELTRDIDGSALTVFLDHQPYEFEAEKAAGGDLILCGHTHRGQIFPGNLITRMVYRLDYGMMCEDGCTMIVSSGAGTWGPRVRLGSDCEVVRIDVKGK